MSLKNSLSRVFLAFAEEGKVISPNLVKKMLDNEESMKRFEQAFISKEYNPTFNNDILEKEGDKLWNWLMIYLFSKLAKDKIESTEALAYLGDFIQSNLEMIKYMESLGLMNEVKKLNVSADKVYADAFEALVKAMYDGILDITDSEGMAYEGLLQFVKYIFTGLEGGKYMPNFNDPITYKSKKTILKEWFQDHLGVKVPQTDAPKQLPNGSFMAITTVETKTGKRAYKGIGSSKQEATDNSQQETIDKEIGKPGFELISRLEEAKKQGVQRKNLVSINLSSPTFKTERSGDNFITTVYNEGILWEAPLGITNPIIEKFPIITDDKNAIRDLLLYIRSKSMRTKK